MARKRRCITGAYKVHSDPLTADPVVRTTSGQEQGRHEEQGDDGYG